MSTTKTCLLLGSHVRTIQNWSHLTFLSAKCPAWDDFLFSVPAFAVLQEHYEAVMRRTLERSQRVEQRQKRWSWGGLSPDQDSRAGRNPLCNLCLVFIMHPPHNPAWSELYFVLPAVGVKWSPVAISQVSSASFSITRKCSIMCVFLHSSLRAVFPHRRIWCQCVISSNYSCLLCLSREASEECTRFYLLIILHIQQHSLGWHLRWLVDPLSLSPALPLPATLTCILAACCSLTCLFVDTAFVLRALPVWLLAALIPWIDLYELHHWRTK